MLDKLKESIEKLEDSEEYEEYMKDNKGSYLVSGFLILEDGDWQIDYYSPSSGMVTAFLVREKVKVKPESQAFQKEKKKIEELDLEKIKVNFEEAMEIVEKVRKEKYETETANKKIIVLQNLEDLGQVWNITLITHSFKTLNVKVDCKNGEVKSEGLTSVINFG